MPIALTKPFRCARIILSGIEVVHMIRKGQMQGMTPTAALPNNSIHLLQKEP
jgi:hypothetical protein